MGYGHMRPAEALAAALGTEVLHCDRAPLAPPDEQRLWAEVRRGYELTSRVSQLPVVGAPAKLALEAVTYIPPLYPRRDMSGQTMGTRALARFGRRGLGAGLVAYAKEKGAPILSTYFTPAVLADGAAEGVHCVVTDSEINRVWAPLDPAKTKVTYFAPSVRALRRLRAYGVPRERIHLTGFPLPDELVGGRGQDALRRNLAARLGRLDPAGAFRRGRERELEAVLGQPIGAAGPPRIVFAVGGAGSQVGIGCKIADGLARPIRDGKIKLTLVAGVRAEVKDAFDESLRRGGLADAVDVLFAPTVPEYLRSFNTLLAGTDVLWSKPSEITFFGGLGLAMVFSPPVGVHEEYNRQWAIENGAGLAQHKPEHAADWLEDWLDEGTLANAAWNGFRRLPSLGLYEIVDQMRRS
jgi:hypothetical protein